MSDSAVIRHREMRIGDTSGAPLPFIATRSEPMMLETTYDFVPGGGSRRLLSGLRRRARCRIRAPDDPLCRAVRRRAAIVHCLVYGMGRRRFVRRLSLNFLRCGRCGSTTSQACCAISTGRTPASSRIDNNQLVRLPSATTDELFDQAQSCRPR